MLICIVGRTGSGKDYLAKKFEEKGLKQIKSYTTRPKRNENEDTHTFITKEEADKITDKIAVTEINGYEYFATHSQVKENDIYIIDPNGLKVLCENLKDESMIVIYVKADDEERKKRAIDRADDEEKELEIFNKRNESENEQFTEFEKLLDMFNEFNENHIIYNKEYSDTTYPIFANFYLNTIYANIYLKQMRTDCIYSNYKADLVDSLYLYYNRYIESECNQVVSWILESI